MAYIIQAEEQDISFHLLQQLAAVLAETPGLTHADATYRIHSSHGILALADKAEATRISQRFTALGFQNFLRDELLHVPRPEHLNLEKPGLDGEAELVVAARLHVVTERHVLDINPFRIRMAYPEIPIPGSSIEESTVEERDTHYCLDLFTSARHWRARPGSLPQIQAFLGATKKPDTCLNAGARDLINGERHLPTFGSEEDYKKYVTWLYQLRYAKAR
jgi:hypothetical protein